MKKRLILLLIFIIGFATFAINQPVLAAVPNCGGTITGLDNIVLPEYPETTSHTISIDMSSGYDDTKNYSLETSRNATEYGAQIRSPIFKITDTVSNLSNEYGYISVQNKIVTWTITSQDALTTGISLGGVSVPNNRVKTVFLTDGIVTRICKVGEYEIEETNNPGRGCTIEAYQSRNGDQCYLNQSGTACVADGKEITVKVSNLKDAIGNPWPEGSKVGLSIAQEGWIAGEADSWYGEVTNGEVILSFTPNANDDANFTITVEDREWKNETFPGCTLDFSTSKTGCGSNQCQARTVINLSDNSAPPEPFSLCKQIPEELKQQRDACEACTNGNNQGVWTAIGCIKRDPQSILQKFIKVGLGISGGVALLTFLAAGFIFSTSQGDPKAYGKAKEMMAASIMGIIFVIFSVTILQFIGYEILKIPGFGG